MRNIFVRLKGQHRDIWKDGALDGTVVPHYSAYLLDHFIFAGALSDKDKLHIRGFCRKFFHYRKEHIYILGQTNIACIGDIELGRIQTILLKQLVVLTWYICHCIFVNPVIDDFYLLFGYAFGHYIFLEILGDDYDLVCIAICKVLYDPAGFPKKTVFPCNSGTDK